MPDESVPYIRQTNDLLHQLRQDSATSVELLRRQSEQLQLGMSVLKEAIERQTSTLGELQIIEAISNLTALQQLLGGEEARILEEERSDREALGELDGTYSDSLREIEAKRNRQVGEVLAMVYALWNEHLVGGVLRREALRAQEHLLQEYVTTTGESLEARSAALEQSLADSRGAIERFAAERQEVHAAIRELQHAAWNSGGDGDGEAVAIPFYVVEVLEPDGGTRHEVIGPSAWHAEPVSAAGGELRQLPAFETLRAALFRSDVAEICRPSPARTAVWRELLPAASGNLLTRLANRFLRSAIDDQPLLLRSVPAGARCQTLAELVRWHLGGHQAGSGAATPEPEGTGPESDFDVAISRLHQQRYREALEIFERLAGAESSPILERYRDHCRRALAEEAQ